MQYKIIMLKKAINLFYKLAIDYPDWIPQEHKEELEKINEMTYENVDLKKQILLSKYMPLNVKTLSIEKINEMKLNNNDYK